MDDLSQVFSFSAETVEIPFEDNKPYIDWLLAVAKAESKQLNQVAYLFCDDAMILEVNKQHLNHNFYTDIITFPYNYEPIECEIIISLDRIKENAQSYKIPVDEELRRVMVHGLLHMCGYDDKDKDSESLMRKKENYYLSIFG